MHRLLGRTSILSIIASGLLAAGCQHEVRQHSDVPGKPGKLDYPPYNHYAGLLQPMVANWQANAFALHLAYVFDPPRKDAGSYWILFDGENATRSNSPTLHLKDIDDDNTDADFELFDGNAYVYIDHTVQLPDKFRKSEEHPTLYPKPWPIVITQQIRVGAQGTEFIVQNDTYASKDNTVQRVFLLDTPDQPLLVFKAGTNTLLSTLSQKDHYSEFKDGKVVQGKDNQPTPPDLAKQIQSTRNKVGQLLPKLP